MLLLSQCISESKEITELRIWQLKPSYNYVIAHAVDLSIHSTHKAVYLAHANMHIDHLLTHSDCHYCKQIL